MLHGQHIRHISSQEINETMNGVCEVTGIVSELGITVRMANISNQAITLQKNIFLGQITPVARVARITRVCQGSPYI